MDHSQDATQYQLAMVSAYLPEGSGSLSWDEAVDLAEHLDAVAADRLSEDVESVLNLEAAAAVISDQLDDYYSSVDWVALLSPIVTGELTGNPN